MGNLIEIKQYKGMTSEVISEMNSSSDYTTNLETVLVNYDYDLLGNIIKETTALGKTINYDYDGNNNLISKEDEDDYLTTYVYDNVNNVSQIKYANNQSVLYTYNPLNQIISMTDSLGTTTYDLDVLGRILSETDNENRVTSYTWDNGNNKTSLTYPDGSVVNYVYDVKGLLETVTDANRDLTTYAYDQQDRLVSELYANDMKTSYTYDELSRIVDKTTRKSDGSIIQGSSFTYDGVGNKLTEDETVFVNNLKTETSNYTYDQINQLTGVFISSGLEEKYFMTH